MKKKIWKNISISWEISCHNQKGFPNQDSSKEEKADEEVISVFITDPSE